MTTDSTAAPSTAAPSTEVLSTAGLSTAPGDPGASLAATRVKLGEFEYEIGPLGHLAAERERLASLAWRSFEVVPLAATIGAEISGVHLGDELPDATIAELRQALLDYKVLCFRDQSITAARHVAFARRFGDLEIHPFIPANGDHPELVRFAKSADVGGYENGWHSDVSWRAVPSMAAVLHAVAVPPSGGDTLFADMYAAYDGLDDELRARVDGLVAVHDHVSSFGHQVPPEQREAIRAQFPPVEHPVVRTHPETGRKLIYVNRFFTSHIVGLGPDESHALIERLSRQADVIEYQCRIRWAPDTVVMWDNRAVQHYACSDYWPSVRVMERASIVGDAPV
jgi:alpha-ketoglutarate-dependent taurine dioxygenase